MAGQFAKILGETFFEANIKAEIKYGKDNFEVISSKRIQKPIYMGLGHKELVELTICTTGKKSTKAPTRPSPSIEITKPRHALMPRESQEFASSQIHIPAPASLHTAIKPASLGVRAYCKHKDATQTMRPVYGMRSNQEGSLEPRSQRIAQQDSIAPEHIDNILAQLQAVKEERKRHDSIGRAIKSPAPGPAIRPQSSTSTPIYEETKLAAIEEKISGLYDLLQGLNFQTSKAVKKETPDVPQGLYEVRKNLLAIETPLEVTDQVVGDLKSNLPPSSLLAPDEAWHSTTSWLEHKLRFSPELEFNRTNGPTIITLIGPTGVGKTTTIAKLAASYGLNMKERKTIALFTLDTYRIGAAEQLQQYAQIIDVDMEILYRPEDVETALERHMDKDLIIVDTAGRCQKDTDELSELKSFIAKLPNPSKYLVLSATSKYTDMLDAARCFSKVGFDHLIFTKIDETNTVGPLLGLLYKTGKSLAFITNGQKVPEDFRRANFDFFNSRIYSNMKSLRKQL